MLRHTTLCAFVVFIALMGTTHAQGRNGICGELTGNAFGLCNAYCEAMDCDGDPNASDQACTRVAMNFARATDGGVPPCVQPLSGSQAAGCPCNFDDGYWTSQDQLLLSVPMCGPEPCITCQFSALSGSTTFLSVTVNRWDNGMSSQQETLFFYTDGAACLVDVSFASGATTEQQPVTSEQFSGCVSEIAVLDDAFRALCQ